MQVRGARANQLKKKNETKTNKTPKRGACILSAQSSSIRFFFPSFFSEGEKKQTMKAHILCRLGKILFDVYNAIHHTCIHLSLKLT